jgi:patatin-related protein
MMLRKSDSEIPNIEKEFRFAVVMYGGVSLAIYINGVAQELYKMVRATATNKDGTYFIKSPQGTEAIYRDLGKQLKARFVVDVLSGTSAGGINAVYLAKALANDESMSNLEDLWIREGDIRFLINDKDSINDIKQLKLMSPPKSLLNSQRIYYKLLYALQNMDKTPSVEVSPYVDELDLYVTSTDILGLPRPIVLTDREAHEKRFRTVFHFYYSALGNDDEYWLTKTFESANNPFLAFVARATCALPAFQPANLSAAMDLEGAPYSKKDNYADLTRSWSRFLRDYSETEQFGTRFFGDGGALDNKPFSYITETLLRRQSNVPIERRLFFIEPAPEHFEDTKQQSLNEPNMIENLLAQGFGLPRYETIREDLLQIKTRNELIERTNNILRQIERTGGNIGDWKDAKIDWRSAYLDQILADNKLYGPGYAAYHKLRVSVALDDFATAVARNIGIPEESSAFLTLRQIFEGWRTSRYSSKPADNRRPENELLYRLDLAWRLRRLQFILRIIDKIHQAINDFRTDIEHEEETYARDIVRNSLKGNNGDQREQMWSLPGPEAVERYRAALAQVKDDIKQAYSSLRIRGRQLRQRNLALKPIDDEDFQKDPELRAYRQALQPLLELKDRIPEIAKDNNQLEKTWEAIEELSLTLASPPEQEKSDSAGYLHQTFRKAARLSQEALATQASNHQALGSETPLPEDDIRACLQFYYDNFEYYDKLTFPITYATPIGEAANVKVYRISPQDADALYKETETRRKLAGTKYFNFGAFFSEEWRRNDILWGQLDGAERIITTLLQNRELQEEYLVRAWLAILKEKRNLLGTQNLHDLQNRFEDLETRQPSWKGAWERFEGSQDFSSDELKELKGLLNNYFECNYKIEPKPAEDTILNVLTRSGQVTEELLKDLVQKYPILFSPSALFGRLIRFLISFMPGNEGRGSFERWFRIAYGLEGFLLVVSILLAFMDGAMQGFNQVLFWLAGISLLLTFIIHRVLQHIGRRVMKFLLSWL